MLNSLNVKVVRPNQKLLIMVGTPGSGKSTKAKQLVGDGIIHSTDSVIEAIGDYNEFFQKMVDNNDFTPLSKAHSVNFKNSVTSMKKGVTPVIIDNTNIKPSQSKCYVEAALNLGYSDDNIIFVEVGTSGLSTKELVERCQHVISLDKMSSFVSSYNAHKPLTLEKVLKSKDMYNKVKMFTSLVINDSSRLKLIQETSKFIPDGWKVIAHHMTINFGKGLPENLKSDLGEKKVITATEIGISEMAVAVRVEGYHSDNKIPHITLAINPNGGKPVMSNYITEWEPLERNVKLVGVISEEKLG